MALSGLDILFNVPLGILVIYIGAGQGPAPWISWEDTHYNFSRIGLFPAILWRLDKRLEASIELTRWLPVFCSFVFFALFGFASEARKHYHTMFWASVKLFGIKPRPSPQAPKALLPRFVPFLSRTILLWLTGLQLGETVKARKQSVWRFHLRSDQTRQRLPFKQRIHVHILFPYCN
jgi:hypothetical protein